MSLTNGGSSLTRRQRIALGVVPEAEAMRRDPAARLDMRRFGADDAGAARSAGAEMLDVLLRRLELINAPLGRVSYVLPGGHVRPSESLLRGAVRHPCSMPDRVGHERAASPRCPGAPGVPP